MKICVAGWYFRPRFLKMVHDSEFDVFVVKHREGDAQGNPSELRENRGLEFGAYRQYVENHWDGVSDVLFIHDDTEIACLDVIRDIEGLANMGVEQAYIFPDEIHEMVNGGAHGRALWIRGDILAKLAKDFPADMTNSGINVGVIAQKGVLEFHKRIMQCGNNAGVCVIVPGLNFGHRGRIHDTMFVYRRTNSAQLLHI